MSWVQSNFSGLTEQPKKKRKIDRGNSAKQEKLSDFDLAQNRDWANKWKPKFKGDLIVNKKKIEEVENWLEWTKKGVGSSILLLTGPPGCGKSTTLKVLCSHLGVNLVEWIPQVAIKGYDPESKERYESDIVVFEEFVMRATRYPNVLNSQSSRLIVVKDIPNGFLRDNTVFHEFLDKYMCAEQLYLTFITTDFNITRDLFSENIKSKYNVKVISFNPLTQRSVKIALQKIANGKFIEYIEGISLSCNGDLRNATATLQFLSVKGKLPQKRARKKDTNENEFTKKSDSMDLFHGLGRVLYAKRETNGKLTHSPIEVAESFISSPELFVGMLQQNYLHTFSSIHEVAKSSETLSVSNIILSDYKDTRTSRSLGTILASNGLMTHNSKPIKKFQQFDKPGKVTNNLMNFKIKYFKESDYLSDLISYGRYIPEFKSSNGDLLSMCSAFK